MLSLHFRDNETRKKTFLFLLKIDPMTSTLTTLSFTHFSNLSFCLLLLTCLCLSTNIFSHFCFVNVQLYFLCLTFNHLLSRSLVAFSCFSVCFKPVCHFCDCLLIDHVISPSITIFCSFHSLWFVNWIFAFNC